jgi:chorismate mutase
MARKTPKEVLESERQTLLKQQAALETKLAKNDRKTQVLVQADRSRREAQLGRLAYAAGLGGVSDEVLKRCFRSLAAEVRQVDREVQALIDNNVTLVLVDDEGKALCEDAHDMRIVDTKDLQP